MKAKDMRDLSADEMRQKEQELHRELFNLRFQKAAGQLGNTAALRRTKKDLARIKTVLREEEITG